MSVEIVTIIVFIIAGVIAGISAILSYRRRSTSTLGSEWWSNYLQGVSTEMVGAITTAILFTVFVGSAQNTAVLNQLKVEIIRKMGSADNATAINAVSELSWRGWLADGSIHRAYLGRANLKGAQLTGADLRGVIFVGADLQWANLTDAQYNIDTILPDGSSWTPNVDMSRFTNPEHPNFWRSTDPASPAYRNNTPGGS